MAKKKERTTPRNPYAYNLARRSGSGQGKHKDTRKKRVSTRKQARDRAIRDSASW